MVLSRSIIPSNPSSSTSPNNAKNIAGYNNPEPLIARIGAIIGLINFLNAPIIIDVKRVPFMIDDVNPPSLVAPVNVRVFVPPPPSSSSPVAPFNAFYMII